ncbi:PD-(D/E)XK nuclease-like domain-containing protein [Vibrio owensii]|uniref:PD-(D/E)XK nuclease-like domain-containing protein n=1 Tax=Vibrio owensii TaxID=696485 RepID=UPI0040695ACA
MGAALNSIDTGLRFNGSSYPVLKAYDDKGNKNWLDDEGDLNPGIYIGMENEVYHALPAYSSSQIKTLVKKTPAHFYREYISDICRKRKSLQQERTLDAGTYGHELILEPDGFNDRYFRDFVEADFPNALKTLKDFHQKCEELNIAVPKSADKARCIKALRDANADIEIFDEIREAHAAKKENQGKKSIDAIVWDDAHRVKQSQEANPYAKNLVKDGLPEISFIARCPMTGLWLKCRFDWLRFDCIAVDVKTTASTEPSAFSKQAGNLGYHIQQAFYTYVASLLEVNVTEFLFLTVEYVEIDWCEVYTLDNEVKSMEKMLNGLKTLKHCLYTNEWRGHSHKDEIKRLKLSPYAL